MSHNRGLTFMDAVPCNLETKSLSLYSISKSQEDRIITLKVTWGWFTVDEVDNRNMVRLGDVGPI